MTHPELLMFVRKNSTWDITAACRNACGNIGFRYNRKIIWFTHRAMQLAALVLNCGFLALSFRLRLRRWHCNGREPRKLSCAERTKSVIGLYYGIANGTGVHLCIVSICGSRLRNPRCSFFCSAKGTECMIIIKLCIAIEAEMVFFNLHLCSAKRTESKFLIKLLAAVWTKI